MILTMQENAVIVVIIGGLTAMGVILWVLGCRWFNTYRKWAEDLRAKQDRQQTTQRADSEMRARTLAPPRIPTAPPPPRVHFASPVATTARPPQSHGPGSTDTSDLTQTSSASSTRSPRTRPPDVNTSDFTETSSAS